MSRNNLSIAVLLIIGICFCTIGCASSGKSDVHTLSLGYCIKEFPPDLAGYRRAELQYKPSAGKPEIIWPYVTSAFISRDASAAFTGWLDKRQRLFWKEKPDLVVDVTDEALRQWAASTGKDSDQAVKTADLVYSEVAGEKLFVKFVFWNSEKWPPVTLALTGLEMHLSAATGKASGTTHRFPFTDISYIDQKTKGSARN